MFILDNVAKPLPHEKYPLVTYKTIIMSVIETRGAKSRMSSLYLKYVTKKKPMRNDEVFSHRHIKMQVRLEKIVKLRKAWE